MEFTEGAAENETNATYLDEPFVARQKRRLEEVREVLLGEIADLSDDEREWNEERREAPDFGSYASARGLDWLLENKLGHRLAFVERALTKIEEGTYGICDATGKLIPRGRLEAIPEAIYTLEASKSRGATIGPKREGGG